MDITRWRDVPDGLPRAECRKVFDEHDDAPCVRGASRYGRSGTQTDGSLPLSASGWLCCGWRRRLEAVPWVLLLFVSPELASPCCSEAWCPGSTAATRVCASASACFDRRGFCHKSAATSNTWTECFRRCRRFGSLRDGVRLSGYAPERVLSEKVLVATG